MPNHIDTPAYHIDVPAPHIHILTEVDVRQIELTDIDVRRR